MPGSEKKSALNFSDVKHLNITEAACALLLGRCLYPDCFTENNPPLHLRLQLFIIFIFIFLCSNMHFQNKESLLILFNKLKYNTPTGSF